MVEYELRPTTGTYDEALVKRGYPEGTDLRQSNDRKVWYRMRSFNEYTNETT